MSINKIYLPELKVLEDTLSESGSQFFYFRYVRNREVFIGSSESIEFINQFTKKYEVTS
jgi:hypothetical protein